MISALLTGGVPVQLYRCDTLEEDGCLNPTLSAETLPRERSLAYKVDLMVSSLHQHLLQEKPLTDEQQAFVNSTMIPILRILAVEMAFKAGGSPESLTNYKDAIAHDILLQYLDDVMDLVWNSTTHLKHVQINDKMIESFRRGIASARKTLFAKRTSLFQQISLTLEAIERTKQIERKLQNQFISSVRGKE